MINELPAALERGCNPVEIAGFGRESTHKGYLTWLLNTQHWPNARDFLIGLLNISERDSALKLIERFPTSFWCEFETNLGSGRVDLCIHDDEDNQILPIELKTDTVVGSEQLENLTFQNGEIGLVFLLGSSAIRDDNASEEERHGYKLVSLNRILTVLEEFKHGLPNPGKDWCQALRNENSRLSDAFDLSGTERNQYFWKYGYRNEKHLYFALLNSVKKSNLSGECSLYDGGRNVVLNFHGATDVAYGSAKCFWEFNNKDLCLKVEVTNDNNRSRVSDWIFDTQNRISDFWVDYQKKEQANLDKYVTLKPPRAPKQNATWISVRRWKFNFDVAQKVACRSKSLMNFFNEMLSLNMQ